MKKIISVVLCILILNPSVSIIQAAETFSAWALTGEAGLDKDPDLPQHPFTPGDGILISTLPDTSSFLNGIFPIDDRGYVELPITGKIRITNMSVEEVKKYIRTNFVNYLGDPEALYVKPVIRISLLGGFQRPGLYYVDYQSSLWDVVRLAGGPLKEEGIYEMHWQRNGEEKTDDLTQLFERGASLKKIGIKSGDQIWTPSPDARTFWTTVAEVMPMLTFFTTLVYLYMTYRRDTFLMQSR
ncbi:MAG TPA: hypothetical protein ENK44_11095 [Caldithrix abyssi]|uniref:Polysaccharide export protein N-terminal domain-containing protein n=1 Tax=Caldithrix abyssi TaxID=187145 RepID=A0A7V4UEC8_CALAY|nr:hypothetical protein [Caldithrix abyssi]